MRLNCVASCRLYPHRSLKMIRNTYVLHISPSIRPSIRVYKKKILTGPEVKWVKSGRWRQGRAADFFGGCSFSMQITVYYRRRSRKTGWINWWIVRWRWNSVVGRCMCCPCGTRNPKFGRFWNIWDSHIHYWPLPVLRKFIVKTSGVKDQNRDQDPQMKRKLIHIARNNS